MLRVLRVLQIPANRLWTCLEGEEEESEEDEDEEASAGRRRRGGGRGDRGGRRRRAIDTLWQEAGPRHNEEGASADEPEDTVVPEKHSSSYAKAARSTMLEVKHEPQTMAEKKKRKSEERSPPKVLPKKSQAERPKKKKDKDKPARGNVSFAIGGKGPQKSISAAPTRPEKF